MNNLDINIHQISFGKDKNFKYKGCGNAHTHGMEKYGFFNLCLAVELELQKTIYILNTVAELLCNSEEIAPQNLMATHYVDTEDGTNIFKFQLRFVICYDELCLLVVLADENGNFSEDEECLEPYCYQGLDDEHEIKPLSKGVYDNPLDYLPTKLQENFKRRILKGDKNK